MSDKEAKSSQENLAGSHAEKSKPQRRAPLKKKKTSSAQAKMTEDEKIDKVSSSGAQDASKKKT